MVNIFLLFVNKHYNYLELIFTQRYIKKNINYLMGWYKLVTDHLIPSAVGGNKYIYSKYNVFWELLWK